MDHIKTGVNILATGQYLPTLIETNEELCKNLNIDPSWIIDKTGITCRYKVADGETCSSMATQAALQAINKSNISIDDINLIIVCTFSGDYIFPAVSAKVHFNLKCKDTQIFDIQVNCCGLLTGLTVASERMFNDSDIKNALVIGSEVNSKYINNCDINTSVYMSDGASAIILSRCTDYYGILGSYFFTDSTNYEAVRMRNGGSEYRLNNFISSDTSNSPNSFEFMEMNGIATWKQAITHLPKTITKACLKSNVKVTDIDFIIFHQANLNMIQYILKKMGFNENQSYINVDKIGNTGSASLGIALDEALNNNLIKNGQLVLFAAVGAGFTFGASVWRWGDKHDI